MQLHDHYSFDWCLNHSVGKIAKEAADTFASYSPEEHIPLGKNMLTMAMKAISVAGMGRKFLNTKEIHKLGSAYDMVRIEVPGILQNIENIIFHFLTTSYSSLVNKVNQRWEKWAWFLFLLHQINYRAFDMTDRAVKSHEHGTNIQAHG